MYHIRQQINTYIKDCLIYEQGIRVFLIHIEQIR